MIDAVFIKTKRNEAKTIESNAHDNETKRNESNRQRGEAKRKADKQANTEHCGVVMRARDRQNTTEDVIPMFRHDNVFYVRLHIDWNTLNRLYQLREERSNYCSLKPIDTS